MIEKIADENDRIRKDFIYPKGQFGDDDGIGEQSVYTNFSLICGTER